MNRKIILIIAITLVLLAGIFIIKIGTKKINLSPQKKAAKTVSLSVLASQGADFFAKGDLVRAKLTYQRLCNDFPAASDMANWQNKLGQINIKLLFSSIMTPGSIQYEIKPGDNLTKIAKEFNTTVELIKKSNAILDDKIVPGIKLKVWTAPFSILIDKSQNILILKLKNSEEVIKTYMVSTGANNGTPIGNFKITEKIVNPPWFKPGAMQPIPSGDPENILGTRWLGLNVSGYGIHGTTEPQSLGKQVTQGCIRMSNPDVEELYTIIPRDTEVTIID